ncbi:MAG: hypothetical protein RI968_231 [Pseudomonadota bacterium]
MRVTAPAALGEALQDLDTPCLVLDREAFGVWFWIARPLFAITTG